MQNLVDGVNLYIKILFVEYNGIYGIHVEFDGIHVESMWNIMESMWNRRESMWNVMESMWNIMESMESMWNVMESIQFHNGFQWNIPSFHMEFGYSMAIPYGMEMEYYTKMSGPSAKMIPYGIHGIHMEWDGFHMDSIWNVGAQ